MYLNELKVYQGRKIAHIQRLRCNNLKLPLESDIKRNRFDKLLQWGPLGFCYLFMETSSIHGFNHLTTKRRQVFEYLFWLAVMGFGLYGFVAISLSTLTRYMYNPTVISLERNYKDWNTSLPAVTVCPEEKFDHEKLNTVLNDLLKLDEKDIPAAKEFLYMLATTNFSSYNLLPNFTKISPSQYLDAIVNMRFEFEYSSTSSVVDMEEQEMVLTVSEVGLCYSYNSKIAIFINPLSWKSGNYNHSSTKFSLEGSPLDGDIFIQLKSMESAYTVYLHSPEDVPDISSPGTSAYLGSYKTMDVAALSIVSKEDVRSLRISQRYCRFPEESDLTISPKYSYNLCRMECRMRLSFLLCGCIPYFYKSTDYDICDISGMKCLTENKDHLIKLVDKKGNKEKCNCLPTCNDVNYVVESESIMDWTLGTNLRWGLVKYPRERFIREVLFGISDVLVAMGGTAGFFFGCSVLSVVEILYFFTLRLFWFGVKKA